MKKIFNKAELNAKKRADNQQINLNAVNQEDSKARESGFALYRIKGTNAAPFTQIINENVNIVTSKQLLSSAEMALLWQLIAFCELQTNAIVHPETKEFMSISEIAELVNKHRVNTSETINGLLEKGILYEFVNAQEIRQHGRPVSKRPLFFNPEIVFAGDKNKVDATLCRLCMEADRLEKRGILLEWKLWLHSGNQSGKLYRRKTYLRYKKAVKEEKKNIR